MRRYCITAGEGATAALAQIARAASAGVELIQIREKQMAGREMLELCRAGREAVRGSRARILLNDRLDVALAAGMDGVHLPATGLPTAAVRACVPEGFFIGRSCHSWEEVEAADGADFCVLGPIFATPSKTEYGTPLGLEELARAAQSRIPVLALGGVTWENAGACLQRGAAGVAGIRLFDGRGPLRGCAARPA